MNVMRRTSQEFDVRDLPVELGRMVADLGPVRVEVVEEGPDSSFWRLKGIAARRATSVADAVARVRALRDEWD